MIPVLCTSRLRLRPLRPEDSQDYFDRLGRDPAVSQHMFLSPHATPADSAAFLARQLRSGEEGLSIAWALTFPEEDRLFGVMSLVRLDRAARSCSFAYMLGRDFWGQGYGTEALTAAIGYAFTQLGMDTITADHFAENPASGAVMKKAGMTYVRTVPGKYIKNGVSHDAVEYTITREGWHPAP